MTAKPWTDRAFDAFLFDMDGTILNSIIVAEKVWGQWAERHSLDRVRLFAALHGVRAAETVAKYVGADQVDAEVKWLFDAEMSTLDDVVPIAGADALLRDLPKDRWAVVTSAQRELALARIEAVGLPVPDLLVTAEDVSRGKPAPDCFLLAAKRLGYAPINCLVFEDAPAGIAAAEAAGAGVMVISATHQSPMQTPHPIIQDYENVTLTITSQGQLSPNQLAAT